MLAAQRLVGHDENVGCGHFHRRVVGLAS
jgi:hypothetical protein